MKRIPTKVDGQSDLADYRTFIKRAERGEIFAKWVVGVSATFLVISLFAMA
ncbi:hypothetical protein CLV78_105231 [Aliiruegeria haliotis]|uniref:Aa3 type cytochrome c oxidase subunit IV n=1 Tax=Aliiruegeria haliotis TaxID=1280846 RepID=A0A2T0RPW8_9RHOB|nr:hypothetical protein [Aliiruegeria haliotis]PRY23177.1 hypothetical protein CLV78_105231 [Aliiruegeria haliotis]